MKTNLTITFETDVLRKARIRALHEHASVSAVLRERLADYAGRRTVDEGRIR